MSKLEKINSEIKELSSIDFNPKKGESEKDVKVRIKEKKKAVTKLKFLRSCQRYLQSSPTQEFIQKEIDRLQNRITSIDLLFEQSEYYKEDVPLHINKANKKIYEKELGVPKLRTQLRTLRFIA